MESDRSKTFSTVWLLLLLSLSLFIYFIFGSRIFRRTNKGCTTHILVHRINIMGGCEAVLPTVGIAWFVMSLNVKIVSACQVWKNSSDVNFPANISTIYECIYLDPMREGMLEDIRNETDYLRQVSLKNSICVNHVYVYHVKIPCSLVPDAFIMKC